MANVGRAGVTRIETLWRNLAQSDQEQSRRQQLWQKFTALTGGRDQGAVREAERRTF
jgi:hypothetical protein